MLCGESLATRSGEVLQHRLKGSSSAGHADSVVVTCARRPLVASGFQAELARF